MAIPIMFRKQRHDWLPPRELEQSRPRKVALTGQGKALVTIAILLICGSVAAGTLLGMSAARGARNARLLDEQGEITEGVITRVWRGRDEKRRPYVAYRFSVEGRAYERDARAPLRWWRLLKAGDSIQVRFLQSRPEINHPVELPFSRTPIWVPYVVSAAIAIASPIILLTMSRQRRLLAEGRAAEGVVTGHSRMHRGTRGEKLGVNFTYEFRLLSGAVRQGSAGPVKDPPPIGSTVAILYEAEKPRRNTPYPMPSASYRIAR